jgi:hypothetical protein
VEFIFKKSMPISVSSDASLRSLHVMSKTGKKLNYTETIGGGDLA